LGASPGASTAVQAMMTIVERAFPKLLASDEGQRMIKAMIPSYGETLAENAELLKKVRGRTLETLQLRKETSAEPARGVA
ncbi:malate:quinone oxidoreductase, partial [Marinospirillum sp.]|uniref:malate:quinone oxidoreductase n=1 Tax=Marinospirillum sp. TaxID=2183934 RepID=UPI00286FDF57